MLVTPILFLAFVLLVGFFIWPHDAPAVFHALQTVMSTFIWPLSEFMSLDEGTFGCLLDDMPYAVDLD
jgi:hypothetical protein